MNNAMAIERLSTDVKSITDTLMEQSTFTAPRKPLASGSMAVNHAMDSSEAVNFEKPDRLVHYRPCPEHNRPIRYQPLQKWEGLVVGVTVDHIVARLKGIHGDMSEDDAEIPIVELPPDEREYLMRGAIFYWSIGYRDRPSGRVRESLIRFRRLPEWTREEIQRASEEAERLMDILGVPS